MTELREGIVTKTTSGTAWVHCGGETLECRLKGTLKKDLSYSTSASFGKRVIRARRPVFRDALALGDRVRVTVDGASPTIVEVLPRTTQFARSGFRGREQVLIANLDHAVIVFACAEPRLDPWKLDRFLAAAEYEDLAVSIVANKVDLGSAEEFVEFERVGYSVIPTCAKTGQGTDSLRTRIEGRVSVVSGPSGVGKSSILNALQPGLKLKTTEIGDITFKGKHTTTLGELLPLEYGGWVADTPGVRSFDVLSMSREELALCFREFNPYLGQCRFDDCRHNLEPGCRLSSAASDGEISGRRLESFRIIAAELDARTSQERG